MRRMVKSKSYKQIAKRQLLFVLIFILLTSVIPAVVNAAPAGPHSTPVSPSADPALQSHALTYAPGPLDNPLKGFLPFFFSKTDYATGYPHSMEWSYFALSEIMTNPSNCGSYNWAMIEQVLDEVASRGNQAAIRLYMEYPGGTGTHPGNGIPACFNGNVTMRQNTFWGTTSPDYDSPFLLQALSNFIKAFGAKYDGDPRISYVHMGLIGLWGEWHTWPFDRDTSDGYPNLFPTDASINTVIDAYDNAFNKTKLVIRYHSLGGGHAVQANIGFADDSWPYKEFRSGSTEPKSMTLPVSMGGWSDAFLQLALDVGGENRWINQSIGGEARPEIQGSMFSNWPTGGGQVSNLLDSIELTHISWMINQQGITSYNSGDTKVAEAIRKMGYELSVKESYYNNVGSGSPLKVGVRIENRGVAPFPYPWKVLIGLKDSGGNVVRTWETNWDLSKVQPLQIRTFPDWNTSSSYLNFGSPYYFDYNVGNPGVNGNFNLVMRVVNPLESVSEADVRGRGSIESWQPFLPAKKVRFANAEQNTDGWINLGQISIATNPTAPAAPTNLAATAGNAQVSLSWTASSGA
ncbi:DUF4832 domain-containing protein, partial [Paenibacillus planticolens]